MKRKKTAIRKTLQPVTRTRRIMKRKMIDTASKNIHATLNDFP